MLFYEYQMIISFSRPMWIIFESPPFPVVFGVFLLSNCRDRSIGDRRSPRVECGSPAEFSGGGGVNRIWEVRPTTRTFFPRILVTGFSLILRRDLWARLVGTMTLYPYIRCIFHNAWRFKNHLIPFVTQRSKLNRPDTFIYQSRFADDRCQACLIKNADAVFTGKNIRISGKTHETK